MSGRSVALVISWVTSCKPCSHGGKVCLVSPKYVGFVCRLHFRRMVLVLKIIAVTGLGSGIGCRVYKRNNGNRGSPDVYQPEQIHYNLIGFIEKVSAARFAVQSLRYRNQDAAGSISLSKSMMPNGSTILPGSSRWRQPAASARTMLSRSSIWSL